VANAIKTVDILNMQVATGTSPANVMAATAAPVSTLAVLSMMDTQLRAEDIETLKTEFDALNALDTSADSHGLGSGSSGSSASANAASKAAAAFVNNPDMAQTFDKLSEKLATELAGRMHEKLNAGEWKMKFALKPASLGLVDVQLEMRDGKLTAQFNADTSLTQELIQNGSQRLKEALGQLGMNNASVLVGQGQQQGQASGQSGNSRQGGDNHAKLEGDSVTEALGSVRPRHSNSLQFDTYA
jgi:flagellar hook-length control protein FliK